MLFKPDRMNRKTDNFVMFLDYPLNFKKNENLSIVRSEKGEPGV